jgi:hypothetical protein
MLDKSTDATMPAQAIERSQSRCANGAKSRFKGGEESVKSLKPRHLGLAIQW